MDIFLFVLTIAGIFAFGKRGRRRRRRPPPRVTRPERSRSPRPPRAPRAPRAPRPAEPPPFDATAAAPTPQLTCLTGPARIIDGDSIVIRKTQIRLFGIDAPEINHPYGQKAKWALIRLCKGQAIRAEILETDTHGRTVAKCYLEDGRDLSCEMVKLGLAIDWPKFSGGTYRHLDPPDARKKMWLADARQKGHMHVWAKFEARNNQSS
ncbi:thermonuclease family protein [Roseovarius nubinhibens]|uniref:thermonuclease family protein n=1 Tax=Roseovarius nubinhibens TaxID=314263 RepID=UPI0030B8CAD8